MKHTSNRGFSLVELMVAMTISMIAMVALTEVYSSTRQTSRLQAMQSRLSEDGRFAISMLQRLVSQAGYRASSDPVPIRITTNSSTSTQIQFTGDGVNTVTCDGSLANGPQFITISQPAGLSTSLRCNNNVNDTDWIFATGGNGNELVDFRIGYGVDALATHAGTGSISAEYSCGNSNRDCVAENYVYGITGSPVVSVKLCFILRSEATESSIARAANVTQCDGVTAIANSQNDQRLYRTFNTTVLLKNR